MSGKASVLFSGSEQLTAKQDQPKDFAATSPISPSRPSHVRHRSFNLPSFKSQFSGSFPVKPPPTTLASEVIREEGPSYAAPHIGEPCTLGSLDHLLLCGHKILACSSKPEPCARNCHIRRLRPDYSQPRDIDNSFACFACIAAQVQNCIKMAEVVEAMQTACDGLRMSRPFWVEKEFEAAIEVVVTGKVKDNLRVVSASVKRGAEIEQRTEKPKGLEFTIPKYKNVGS